MALGVGGDFGITVTTVICDHSCCPYYGCENDEQHVLIKGQQYGLEDRSSIASFIVTSGGL